MSTKEFNVQIKLSNAEMQEAFHVAAALRELADRLDDRVGFQVRDSFGIRDINGNQVGSATVDRIGIKGERYSPNFDSATRLISGVEARQALIEIGAQIGAFTDWNGADIAESVAGVLNGISGLPEVSDQSDDALDFWADIADEFGLEPDRPDREDDGNPDGEMDAREDGM